MVMDIGQILAWGDNGFHYLISYGIIGRMVFDFDDKNGTKILGGILSFFFQHWTDGRLRLRHRHSAYYNKKKSDDKTKIRWLSVTCCITCRNMSRHMSS